MLTAPARRELIADHLFQAKLSQDKLSELEKAGAPIDEQLEQAGLFAGVEWLDLLQIAIPIPENETDARTTSNFHGREEWALKWLIKKLHTSETRVSPMAWRLLRCLVERIPVLSAAKILNEKKLMFLLRQALEATVELQKNGDMSDDKSEKPSSKKRRRSGELVEKSKPIITTYDIAESLYEAVGCLMRIADITNLPQNDSSDAGFAKKYMKTVITTSEEEAAKILAAWFTITLNDLQTAATLARRDWVAPFIAIWNARVSTASTDTLAFKTCLRPALALVSHKAHASHKIMPESWCAAVERLVSQCVILPATTAYGKTRDRDTDVLSSFTDEVVAKEPRLSVSLFDIAVRSTTITTNLKTRTHALNWLQAVFKVLMAAIPDEKQVEKNAALVEMLKCCIEESIPLDLGLLQTLVANYGFQFKQMDTKLIGAVVDLNPLAFTLSGVKGKELTEELFKRMTELSPAFYLDPKLCVLHILVVLMGAFAKSRDLVAFVHGWYDQLVAIATRKDAQASVWETETLFKKLKDVMEQSLTPEQVSELSLWLVTKSDIEEVGPGPALAIADAISGAVSSKNYVHQIGNSLWRLAADNFSEVASSRWGHRAWNIMAHCFDFAFYDSTTSRSMLEDVQKEDYYFMEPKTANHGGVSLSVVSLAWFNFAVSYHTFAAVAVSSAHSNVLLRQPNMGPSISAVLERKLTSKRLQKFVSFVTSANEAEDSAHQLSSEAALPFYLETVLSKYPYIKTLVSPRAQSEKGDDSESHLPKEIFSMFWVASLSPNAPAKNSWMKANKSFLPGLWKSMLLDDAVLNNKVLISALIDVMLQCDSHERNPIEKSSNPNAFLVECLSILPIEVFNRHQRESILTAWIPFVSEIDPDSKAEPSLVKKSSTLDASFISLKMKMMEAVSIFESFSEKGLSGLAKIISDFSPEPKAPLAAFAEYVKRVQAHLLSMAGQIRSDEIIRNHLSFAASPKHAAKDVKSAARSGTILYVELILSWWAANEERLSKLKFDSNKSSLPVLSEVVEDQKLFLTSNLGVLIKKSSKLSSDNDKRSMSLYATLEALRNPIFGVQAGELSSLWTQAQACAKEIRSQAPELSSLLVSFFLLHNPGSGPEGIDLRSVWEDAKEDPSTAEGRATLTRAAQSFLDVSNEAKIRQTVAELIPSAALHLDKLVFLRYLIMGAEGQYSNLLFNDTKLTCRRSCQHRRGNRGWCSRPCFFLCIPP